MSLPVFQRRIVNYVRNPRPEGSVAGTPGTVPTFWSLSSNVGLSSSIVGTGTESNLPYLEVRFFGTATGAGVIGFLLGSTTEVSAQNGQTATLSMYQKLAAGTTSNIASVQFGFAENTSAGVFIRQDTTNGGLPTGSALGTQRLTFTSALTGGGTVGALQPFARLNVSAAAAVDINWRIAVPMLEFATQASPVVCLPAAGSTGISSVWV